MLYQPSERVQTMLDQVRQFINEEIIPLESQFLSQPFRDLLPLLEEKRGLVKQRGWWAPQMHAEHGGVGLTLTEFAHLSEELGRTPIGHYLFNCQAPDAGNMEILASYGTPEQKEQFFEPLVAGKFRSCFTMTEPGFAGSNPTQLGTTAVRDGDDYVINGRKWFATGADGAGFAVAMVVTNPEAPKPHQRASMLLVPTDNPGFRIIRNLPVMGDEGSDWASHSEVVYEDCRVPASNLLGEEGGGFRIAQERLGPGRIHHCMRWIGICERAFDMLAQRAAYRELSPGVPLGSKQMIQAWIAESRAEINAARLMVVDTAHRIDEQGTKASRIEISAIKFYVADVLMRVLDRALQAHGGLGMLDDIPIAWWYRHERAARIYDGADEVHKAVIARHVLAGYGVKVR